MKRPKSSSSAHHKKIPQEKFTPLSHSSTNLQVVPPPGGFSRSSSHPLFNFLYGLPNSPILILPSYPGQFPSIHTRILYHLTHLRKLEKLSPLSILPIQSPPIHAPPSHASPIQAPPLRPAPTNIQSMSPVH